MPEISKCTFEKAASVTKLVETAAERDRCTCFEIASVTLTYTGGRRVSCGAGCPRGGQVTGIHGELAEEARPRPVTSQ